MNIPWKDDACIRFRTEHGAVISANRAGLLSLAAQLTALAQEPVGSHIHYDEYNALEPGSAELTVEHADLSED